MILYLDNENDQNIDGFKRALGSILMNAYPKVGMMEFKYDAYTAYGVSESIKNNDDVIVIWNSLKPFCTWAVDLCNRFNKDYVLVERGLVPSQGVDNFCFLAGGLCFDNLNIDPKYFDQSTYDKNKEIISAHYKENDLNKLPSKDKIVFVGQVPWDSTMTHFYDTTDQAKIIDRYIENNNIDETSTQIIYCPHPRMRESFKGFKYAISDRATINECLDAKLVVAVSSTTIYEIEGLGIDTEILGRGKYSFPTKRPWKNIMECLSTALDFHFNTKTDPKIIRDKIEKTVSINREKNEY